MADRNAQRRVGKTEQPGSLHPGEDRWQNRDRYALLLVMGVMKRERTRCSLRSVSTLSAPDWLLTNCTRVYLSVPVTHERKMLYRASLACRASCPCYLKRDAPAAFLLPVGHYFESRISFF